MHKIALLASALLCLLVAPLSAPESQAATGSKQLVNPSSQSSRNLTLEMFRNQYGPSKDAYKRAVKYRDTGYAYDAFMASMAYWHGYNTRGRINRGKSKGKNQERALEYLFKASDLGWPEASLMLYVCYGKQHAEALWISQLNLSARSIPPGNVDTGHCIHRNMDWDNYNGDSDEFVLGRDYEKARFYLERAVEQAAGMRFGYQGVFANALTVMGEPDHFDAGERLGMLLTALRYDAVRYAARQHASRQNLEVSSSIEFSRSNQLYRGSFADCDALFEDVLQRAAYDEEVSCGKSAAGRDGRYCPGQGYQHVRSFLDACMTLAPDEEQRAHYLKLRLSYAHAWLDSNEFVSRTKDGRPNTVFAQAYRYYLQKSDQAMVDIVTRAWNKARAEAANKSYAWDAERARRQAENSRIARAERAAEAERKRRAAKDWEKFQAANQAAEERARREIENSPSSMNDPFMDSLQRQQDQVLLEISSRRNPPTEVYEAAEPEGETGRSGAPAMASGDDRPEMCPYPQHAEWCPPDDMDGPDWRDRWAAKQKECEARDRARHQQWLAKLTPYCRAEHEASKNRPKHNSNSKSLSK